MERALRQRDEELVALEKHRLALEARLGDGPGNGRASGHRSPLANLEHAGGLLASFASGLRRRLALAAQPEVENKVPRTDDKEYAQWLQAHWRPPESGDLAPNGAGAKRNASAGRSVAIVIMAGTADTVAETLESVTNQTLRPADVRIAAAVDGPLNAGQWPAFPTAHLHRQASMAAAVNDALLMQPSGTELVMFLRAGDRLVPQALASLATGAAQRADAAYGDSDRISLRDGETYHSRPFFKPGWSPDLLLSMDYLSPAAVVRRSHVIAARGFRVEAAGVELHDLWLRMSSRLRRVVRVPGVLGHRLDREEPTADAVARIVGQAVKRDAGREFGALPSDRGPIVTWMPLRRPKVSIIIPFRDNVRLTRACLRSVEAHTYGHELEVILVPNGCREPETQVLLDEMGSGEPRGRIIPDDGTAFNWSATNNRAARSARGEVLLFLNNDVEVLTHGWTLRMLAHLMRPGVGAVGARLLFPNGTVQHAGAVVGLTGLAGHPFWGLPSAALTAYGPSTLIRNHLAVTGACLMIRAETFRKMGGFDEAFQLVGSDVDLGLRLVKSGLRVIYTPHAELTHHESQSRTRTIPPGDVAAGLRRFEAVLRDGDPFWNPNLGLHDPRIRIQIAPAEDPVVVARRLLPRNDAAASDS